MGSFAGANSSFPMLNEREIIFWSALLNSMWATRSAVVRSPLPVKRLSILGSFSRYFCAPARGAAAFAFASPAPQLPLAAPARCRAERCLVAGDPSFTDRSQEARNPQFPLVIRNNSIPLFQRVSEMFLTPLKIPL